MRSAKWFSNRTSRGIVWYLARMGANVLGRSILSVFGSQVHRDRRIPDRATSLYFKTSLVLRARWIMRRMSGRPSAANAKYRVNVAADKKELSPSLQITPGTVDRGPVGQPASQKRPKRHTQARETECIVSTTTRGSPWAKPQPAEGDTLAVGLRSTVPGHILDE
jgi:hypothetical protein